MSTLFRPEVVRRQGEGDVGQAIEIVPLSQMAFSSFLIAIILAAILFAVSAGYARKETVPGLITPSQGVIRVQAPRAGTITKLLVAEGDVVAADQVLFQIVVEETGASGAGSDTTILEALKQQKAILQDQIRNEAAHGQAEADRLNAQIRQLGQEIPQIERQRQLQAERAKAARAIYEKIRPLRNRGIITVFEYHNRQATALSEAQSLAGIEQQLSAKRGEIEQAKLSRKRLPIEQADREATLQRGVSDIDQRAAEIEGRRRYVVRAATSGRVTNVLAAVGHTADPRTPLMSIVPVGGHFQAELFVPARAIGFVRTGQHVRLLYDAFPFQRFGTYGGVVTSIGGTMLAPNDLSQPVALKEPAYRVKVDLDRQYVSAFGHEVTLQPDMTLVADIILEKRTLMEWLLEPLLSARGRLS